MIPNPPARRSATRAGFTLVELLVACALTVLVMAILATAFQKGMETLSHLKSAVGLSEQLRAAEAVIRRDLEARHLETRSGGPVRVSDKQLATAAWVSPDRGFFRVKHGSSWTAAAVGSTNSTDGYVQESSDSAGDNVPSFRAWNHELAMTVKLPGGSASEVFVGDAGGLLSTNAALSQQNLSDYTASTTQFAGQWGEVEYFLAPSVLSTTAEDGTAALQLFTLRRRFRVLVPTSTVSVPISTPFTSASDVAGGNSSISGFPELSVSPVSQSGGTVATINTPADVTIPANRLWDFRDSTIANTLTNSTDARATPWLLTPAGSPPAFNIRAIPQSAALGGSDVLLANVVSFQVLALTSADPTGFPALLADPQNAGVTTATYAPGAALDTAFGPAPSSQKPVVRAVKLNLRVYDVRNRMTRQMTIIQDL